MKPFWSIRPPKSPWKWPIREVRRSGRELRGQDFSRWNADWAGFWMIVLKSSENHSWPWSDSGTEAEGIFVRTYPAIHGHLNRYRDALTKRQDQGRYWWELRSCAYWGDFDSPKIMYPEITWRPEWVLDTSGMLCNNTAYILPSDDPWIAAVVNSPVSWWYAWRNAIHGKDEALRFIKEFVQDFPVPTPTRGQRDAAARRGRPARRNHPSTAGNAAADPRLASGRIRSREAHFEAAIAILPGL